MTAKTPIIMAGERGGGATGFVDLTARFTGPPRGAGETKRSKINGTRGSVTDPRSRRGLWARSRRCLALLKRAETVGGKAELIRFVGSGPMTGIQPGGPWAGAPAGAGGCGRLAGAI